LYGAETLTFRKVQKKNIESFEMWCWGTEKIGWTDRVSNEVCYTESRRTRISYI